MNEVKGIQRKGKREICSPDLLMSLKINNKQEMINHGK